MLNNGRNHLAVALLTTVGFESLAAATMPREVRAQGAQLTGEVVATSARLTRLDYGFVNPNGGEHPKLVFSLKTPDRGVVEVEIADTVYGAPFNEIRGRGEYASGECNHCHYLDNEHFTGRGKLMSAHGRNVFKVDEIIDLGKYKADPFMKWQIE
jgi:hypothetical protein